MPLYINMSMYNNVMYNYVQHYAIEMIKNDICNVYAHEWYFKCINRHRWHS